MAETVNVICKMFRNGEEVGFAMLDGTSTLIRL